MNAKPRETSVIASRAEEKRGWKDTEPSEWEEEEEEELEEEVGMGLGTNLR